MPLREHVGRFGSLRGGTRCSSVTLENETRYTQLSLRGQISLSASCCSCLCFRARTNQATSYSVVVQRCRKFLTGLWNLGAPCFCLLFFFFFTCFVTQNPPEVIDLLLSLSFFYCCVSSLQIKYFLQLKCVGLKVIGVEMSVLWHMCNSSFQSCYFSPTSVKW